MSRGRDFGAASVKDVRGLRSTLERTQRDVRSLGDEDVLVDGNRRLLLRSPNGHYWAIRVSDTGVLSAVDVGASL